MRRLQFTILLTIISTLFFISTASANGSGHIQPHESIEIPKTILNFVENYYSNVELGNLDAVVSSYPSGFLEKQMGSGQWKRILLSIRHIVGTYQQHAIVGYEQVESQFEDEARIYNILTCIVDYKNRRVFELFVFPTGVGSQELVEHTFIWNNRLYSFPASLEYANYQVDSTLSFPAIVDEAEVRAKVGKLYLQLYNKLANLFGQAYGGDPFLAKRTKRHHHPALVAGLIRPEVSIKRQQIDESTAVQITVSTEDDPIRFIDGIIRLIDDLTHINKLKMALEELSKAVDGVEARKTGCNTALNRLEAVLLNLEAMYGWDFSYGGFYDTKHADELIRKAEALAPELPLTLINRGLLYRQVEWSTRTGLDKEIATLKPDAIKAFTEAISLAPQSSIAYYYRALLYMQSGYYEKAILDYDAAIERNPNYPMAYNNRGNCNLWLGRHEQALEDYTKAIEIQPDMLYAHENRGKTLHELGRTDEALVHLREVISIDPYYAEGYIDLAYALKSSGRLGEALQIATKAVQIDGWASRTWRTLGDIQHELKNNKAAVRAYNNAILFEPKNTDILYNRSLANGEIGNYIDALSDLEEVIRLEPNNLDAIHNRGALTLKYKQDHQAAYKDFSKVYNLDPKRINTTYSLATTAYELDRFDETIPLARLNLQHKPNDIELHKVLGESLRMTGRYDESIPHLKKCVELESGISGCLRGLGVAQAQTGQLKAAIESFSLAIKHFGIAMDYNDRGFTYLTAGEYENALNDFDKALEIDPDLARALVNRGSTHAKRFDFPAMCADLKQACILGSCNAWVSVRNQGACR